MYLLIIRAINALIYAINVTEINAINTLMQLMHLSLLLVFQ